MVSVSTTNLLQSDKLLFRFPESLGQGSLDSSLEGLQLWMVGTEATDVTVDDRGPILLLGDLLKGGNGSHDQTRTHTQPL